MLPFSSLPIFAAIYVGLSLTLKGILLAVNILLMALLQLYSGNIADRFNRRALVVLGSLTNFIFLALIPFSHNFWQLLGLCALGGLGGAISMPAASALIVEEVWNDKNNSAKPKPLRYCPPDR